MGHPFVLSVTPYKQPWTGRDPVVTVIDRGTAPLAVRATVVKLHGTGKGCGFSPASGVTVSPARFMLTPGHAERTTVHLAAGLARGDYGVVYSATGTGKGGIHLTGAVGSQVTVGGVQAACGRHVAVPAHHAGGADPLALIGVVVAVLAVVLALVARRLHRLS